MKQTTEEPSANINGQLVTCKVQEDFPKAVSKTTHNHNKSDPTMTKRITNLLFAGTVLAGSIFSVPSAAEFTGTPSTDIGYLPDLTSDYSHQVATMGDGGGNVCSSDFSPPVVDAGGNFPSLAEYMGKLFCTACGKHCPLTEPQCGIGANQYQEAVSLYESTVSSDSIEVPSNSDETTGPPAAANTQESNSDAALQNFLGGLICTGCGRHCPLTALQCARGNVYLERAKAEFAMQQEESSAKRQISDGQTANSTNAQSANKGDLFEDVMEYAPFGGLMVGGIYYSMEILKKRKNSKAQQDDKWR